MREKRSASNIQKKYHHNLMHSISCLCEYFNFSRHSKWLLVFFSSSFCPWKDFSIQHTSIRFKPFYLERNWERRKKSALTQIGKKKFLAKIVAMAKPSSRSNIASFWYKRWKVIFFPTWTLTIWTPLVACADHCFPILDMRFLD